MNFNMRHAFRMAKWAKRPPSDKQVKFALAIIAICFALFAVERWVGWPEWLTMDEGPRQRPTR